MTYDVSEALAVKAVCHDVRQELAVIAALAEVAGLEPGLSDSSRSTINLVAKHAAETAQMLAEIVTQAPTSPTVDLSATVRDLVDVVSVVSSASIVACIEDGVFLDVDPHESRRALMNLLDNALRAAGPRGVVCVRLLCRAGSWVIEVEDSGAGFGACAPGLASIGLSVVSDWVADINGRLEFLSGANGGALVRIHVGAGMRDSA